LIETTLNPVDKQKEPICEEEKNSKELLSNVDIFNINPKNFNNFSYSKKLHHYLISESRYDIDFFKKKINLNDFDLIDYQKLLVYSYIKNNLVYGRKILALGNFSTEIINVLKYSHEIFSLTDTSVLNNNLTSETADEILITSSSGNTINLNETENFFDFVFSISAFDNTTSDNSVLMNIKNNLEKFIKFGGFTLHCFKFEIKNNVAKFSEFFLPMIQLLNESSRLINNLYSLESIERDTDVMYLKSNDDEPEINKIVSYNILLIKDFVFLKEYSLTTPNQYLNKRPAYLFHHIIKCGGTSLNQVLGKWFAVEFDHIDVTDELNSYPKYRFDLNKLSSDTCLIGHYNNPGTMVYQRYPEFTKNSDKFKLFTFVREPLKFRISLYYYNLGNKNKDFDNLPLDVFLKYSKVNYFSTLFPCYKSNYKNVLDSYFFIGIVEKMQESFDKLADKLDMKKVRVPYSNKSEKDSQIDLLSSEFIEEFKKNNSLDYDIYNYCLEKFNKL